jgi:catechol 2,3-dioxygenase-like lactoylglutathione lyase family enzyme
LAEKESTTAEEVEMELREARVETAIAVSDLDEARRFYENSLDLDPGSSDLGGVRYQCGGGTAIFVYASAHAHGSTATLAGFAVDDLEQTMAELASRGVTFEHYDQPDIKTDQYGVFDNGMVRAAWVRDPDGNTLALTEVR